MVGVQNYGLQGLYSDWNRWTAMVLVAVNSYSQELQLMIRGLKLFFWRKNLLKQKKHILFYLFCVAVGKVRVKLNSSTLCLLRSALEMMNPLQPAVLSLKILVKNSQQQLSRFFLLFCRGGSILTSSALNSIPLSWWDVGAQIPSTHEHCLL